MNMFGLLWSRFGIGLIMLELLQDVHCITACKQCTACITYIGKAIIHKHAGTPVFQVRYPSFYVGAVYTTRHALVKGLYFLATRLLQDVHCITACKQCTMYV